METVILIAIVCVGMIGAFTTGAHVGQKAVRGEEIDKPTIGIPNPINALREREEKREAQREADRMATILENIENYDGTSSGQKDVPRG